MKFLVRYSAIAFAFFASAFATPALSTGPIQVNADSNGKIIVNSVVLAGKQNSTLSPIMKETISTKITSKYIKPHVLKVNVQSTLPFLGAEFTVHKDDLFYGVWSYPSNLSLSNENTFQLLGYGNELGINWSNARAPFFYSTAGYGVYIDTLYMGSFDFTTPGTGRFVFNTSSLSYYIIQPTGGQSLYKTILQEYTELSARIEMPPDSAYGPNFWSDNFEQDFHGSVSNAQENYFDVINHLFDNKIRATSTFADRKSYSYFFYIFGDMILTMKIGPYGTGNSSFGNFDFDPVFYPTPKEFIANLSSSGFDFQVWVANRAFLYTELYNISVVNNWLFPGYDGTQFLGPALNLSIPEAYTYFKEHLKAFTNVGVKGFKIDRGEEGEMPFYEQNIQMTLFQQLCYEVMVEKWGVGNYYTFSRSVDDRSRARTGVWNGDSASNWTGLQYTVASGIRAGLLAYSMWGSDTGGYTRGANDPTQELWARWMWFSAFSPVYEIMVGTNHTPWYPPYTSSLVTTLKDSADLHTKLIPYIRSYTKIASLTGIPVIRALFLDYPHEEKKVRGITNQYLLGSKLLVAPIVTSSPSRSVYFPGTKKWAAYLPLTASSSMPPIYSGGTTHNISASLNSTNPIPVFVKEGAILATGDIYRGNAKWAPWSPSLVFEVFPSFHVRRSKFEYWSKEANRTVKVRVEVHGEKGSGNVSLSYGDFGGNSTVAISFWVYVAGAVQKLAIDGTKAGRASVRMERSIWE